MFRTSGLKIALGGTSVMALLASGAALAQAANDSQASQEEAGEIDRIVLAQAQTQAQSDVDALDGLELEEIIVTGSRIRRSNFTTTQPIVTVDADVLFNRGFKNVADALNELPSFGVAGNNAQGPQAGGAVGQQFVNSLGLGSSRTLVVIDGKRFVSQAAPGVFNGQQVDLNVIPRALVDRTETLLIGGAPIYGSDAVAGTVNIILKDDFEGAQIDIEGGLSDKGDVSEFQVSSLVGGNFADGRGNAVVAFEFTNLAGALQNTRPKVFSGATFSNFPQFRPEGFNLGLCDFDCDRIFITARGGIPTLSPGGLPLIGAGAIPAPNSNLPARFAPDGSLVPFDVGTLVGGAFAQGGDGETIRDFNALQTDQERFNFFGKARYKITDRIEYKLETLISISDSTELINQPFIQAANFPFEEANLPLRLDNPFLSEQARQTILAGLPTDDDGNPVPLVDTTGDGMPDQLGFFLTRFSSDVLSNAPARTEQFVYSFRTGFEGDFDFGERKVNWDVTYSFGRTETDATQVGLSDRNFFNALDAVRITAEEADLINTRLANVQVTPRNAGDIICRVELDAAVNGRPTIAPGIVDDDTIRGEVTGCAPLNLFGDGAPSDAARDFVSVPFFQDIKVQQHILNGSFGTDLFKIPWNDGALQIAMGFEHRREKSSNLPDGASQVGLGRAQPALPISGEFRVNEGFWEGLLPIITPSMEVPFVQSFEVDGAARHVANNLAGDDRTWTVGGRVRFTQDVMVRGNFTRSIRAPAVGELFAPTRTIRAFITDPCDNRNIDAGPNPATRRANCEAAFAAAMAANPGFDVDPTVPGDQMGLANFRAVIQNQSQPITAAGNRNLSNEVADSWTIGTVLTPRWVPGLSISVDWVDIELSNVIANVSGTVASQACFDDPDFERFCNRFVRGANFQIIDALSAPDNIAFTNFQSLLAQATYESSFSDYGLPSEWGSFRINLNYEFLDQFEQSILGTGTDLQFFDGNFNNPDHEFQAQLNYFNGPFTLFWQSTWQGSTIISRNEPETQRFPSKIKAGSIHNFSMSYNITENVDFRFVVSNVLDRSPPVLEQIATGAQSIGGSSTIFDVLGRRFSFGLRFSL